MPAAEQLSDASETERAADEELEQGGAEMTD
jgi:hypothetical protein